jgi:hypothetical protein
MVRDGLLSRDCDPSPLDVVMAVLIMSPPLVSSPSFCLLIQARLDILFPKGTTFTKSWIIKDERDILMRRVRHRDNRLLKGDIGLTTGLGWSDR